MKLHFSTDWLRKKLASEPDEPAGCAVCGAIAGACREYPNCPGNPERKSSETKDGDDWCYEHGYREHKRDSPACERASEQKVCGHLYTEFVESQGVTDKGGVEKRRCLDCRQMITVHTTRPPLNGSDK